MREWHLEHTHKTVVKYVRGLSASATNWEKRNHKRYYSLTSICKQIEYDMRHGVTKEEVMFAISEIHSHPSFASLRSDDSAMARLARIEEFFVAPKQAAMPWH
jgi:hypothetical protein